jgi:dihydroorotate dehydrogenase electron transfer subunit
MSKRIEDLKVVANRRLNKDFFVVDLLSEKGLMPMYPGQFAQVKVDGSPETFLRRPISVHDVDYSNNIMKFLIQIVGKGTNTLSNLKGGDRLNVVYPLGKSFSMPDKSAKVLLVGGGCGIAPLLFLGNHLKTNGYKFDILLGFRNRDRVIEYEEYQKLGNVHITTEDGSMGEKGFVTGHSAFKSGEYTMMYVCGPESMMKSVARHCKENNIGCEVSLENLMACGIGACLCCVVETTKGNLCTCTDGPIFNIKELKW